MDIVYKKKDRIAFKAIAIGDVFSYGGTLYMSTPEVVSKSTGDPYNAVRLDIDGFEYISDNDEVTPVKDQLMFLNGVLI